MARGKTYRTASGKNVDFVALLLANETAPLTNKSPPIISKTNPNSKKIILYVITYHFYLTIHYFGAHQMQPF